MDVGSEQMSMEKVEVPLLHKHSLIPFTRFASNWCRGCSYFADDYVDDGKVRRLNVDFYGGYRCNETECYDFVFHKECGKPLQEINHSSHPHHSLKLIIQDWKVSTLCSFCEAKFKIGYCCSICDFKLDLKCARSPTPLVLPGNSHEHEHPLQLVRRPRLYNWNTCNACHVSVNPGVSHYRCRTCEFFIHVDCVDLFPGAYNSTHPQHPLKSLKSEIPHYADKECLLCATNFDGRHHQLHHCDVCNFSICRACMKNPPPVEVKCITTHQHQLHLVPRRIDFTCNACGTQGDRSPYFCLQCNFMIHRQCIDLPRLININRHDHRIRYTPRLGQGEWECKVCRGKMDGFYGGYTCHKCPTLAVHSLCATDKRVWDMLEREGTPEEEEIAPPFEVIGGTSIKHFSHDHALRFNMDDGDGRILPESKLCVACVFQICSEPFYSCEQCEFFLHEKCAHLPRKIRHVRRNQPFTLHTDARDEANKCDLCFREFTGFRYKCAYNYLTTIDVRCASTSDSLEHESHEHPLHYFTYEHDNQKCCSQCGDAERFVFGCHKCDYFLDAKCALLPKKVMKKRYDDHPIFLCFGEKNVEGEYWCEACETKVDAKKWFYTCNDCGITLHMSCVVGDFTYIMPGSVTDWDGVRYVKRGELRVRRPYAEVVSNISVCRPLCFVCNSLCLLPSILKLSKPQDGVYICSHKCRQNFREEVIF